MWNADQPPVVQTALQQWALPVTACLNLDNMSRRNGQRIKVWRSSRCRCSASVAAELYGSRQCHALFLLKEGTRNLGMDSNCQKNLHKIGLEVILLILMVFFSAGCVHFQDFSRLGRRPDRLIYVSCTDEGLDEHFRANFIRVTPFEGTGPS